MSAAKLSHKPYYTPAKFAVVFVSLFLLFYYFNLGFFSLTSPGKHYNPYLATHFNYIHWLRQGLLHISAAILRTFGYTAITDEFQLLVPGHGIIQLVYTCLGLGVMSFFAAFVLAYPKQGVVKYWFLIIGLITIQLLNIARFVLLALYWKSNNQHIADHHTLFNLIIYILIVVSLYFWVKNADISTPKHEN